MTEAELDPSIVSELQKIAHVFVELEVLTEWSQVVESSIQENFRVGGRFSVVGSIIGGLSKWPALSPEYAKQKAEDGYSPIRLTRTARLRNSVGVFPSPGGIVMFAGAVYAAAHNFGYDGGGRHIPGAPFLVVQEDDFEELLDIGQRFINSHS